MALHTFSVPGFPLLRGRRARLRAPRAGDADRLFALFADADTLRWWPRAPMRTQAEALAYIEECAEFFASGARIDWAVVDAADIAIGTCTLYAIDPRRHHAEIGYALHPAHRGRGIAGDAVAQAIAWGVRVLGMRRIEARVAQANLPSQRLLQGLGFVRAQDPDADADPDADPDGVARWALDAVAAGYSRRSGESR